MAKQKRKQTKTPKAKLNKQSGKKPAAKPKKQYKVRNWKEYNEALKARGRLDVWVEKGIMEQWYAKPSGTRGAQEKYSNLAIETTLRIGHVFRQKLRQTEGLVKSLFSFMKLSLDIPNFTTLSRRGETVEVRLPKDEKEGLVMLIDSTGFKVFGEGEWMVKKHGWSKHRTWRKFHFAVDPDGEFRAVELTENSVGDSETVQDLFNQESASIDTLITDGAYDTKNVYDVCKERNVPHIVIPPREGAKIWNHGNTSGPPHPRDQNLRMIRKTSIKSWKEETGYHLRSLAENAVYRFKTILGNQLNARKLANQKTESLIKASILNRMMKLGMPDSYLVPG